MVFRRFLILVACFALFGSIPLATGQPAARPATSPEDRRLPDGALEQLAHVVKGWVQNQNIVGAELLVIQDRRTLLHEAFGWQDQEAKIPMKRNTLFNIRSMTKTLTGEAAQLLIDEGKLKLTDPVGKYLEGFSTGKARAITIEQLLTHRSGLPLSILSGVNDHADLEAMANAVGQKGPEFEPGSRFWYSDSGTDALGAVVARIAGCSLDTFITRRLLEPLGMKDSLYPKGPDDPRWSRIASLYFGGTGRWTRVWKPEKQPFYPFAWGSQSLYTTPRDYARFLGLWLDQGKAGDRQILSRAAIARALTPVSPMTQLGSRLRFPTGFPGLETWSGQMAVVHVKQGGKAGSPPVDVGHSGSDGTIAWAWPDRKLMILYFTQSRGQATALRLEKVVDRLLLHPENYPEKPASVPAGLKPFLGTYLATFGPFVNTEFVVLVEDGRLALDIPDQIVFPLEEPDPEGKRRFHDDAQTAVSFVRDEKGAVSAMKFHSGSHTFTLPRGKASDVPALDPETVRRYLGRYRDESSGTLIEFVIHEGCLAARVPESPLPLVFVGPDQRGRWRLRANPVISISFQEDENGRVVSYTVHHPGGTIVRPRVEPTGSSRP